MKKWRNRLVIIAIVAVVAIAIVLHTVASNDNAAAQKFPEVGAYAPNAEFYTLNGSPVSLSAYRGHMVVLWFVATWCSGCAQGNAILNSSYAFLNQKGVKILEIELYKDLGYSGPTIGNFVSGYAPAAYAKGVIVPMYSSYNMTLTYDPKGYLDIYYLLSPSGKILYTNSPLAATLPQLAAAINASV